MLALQLVLVLVLLAICGFAPGFFFIRRLRWTPLEKLCGSIGLSFVLLYLAFGAAYCLTPAGAETQRAVVALISIACAVMGINARRDIVRLLAWFRVWQALLGFCFLLIWTLVLLSIIRHYSGAYWKGDWQEHFQRTLFFLHHFPANTPIFVNYQLPARPPMMNMLAAFFLAQAGDRFELFQVVFAFLNLLIFLPSCLIMPVLTRRRRTYVLPLVALFAMNPMLMQNTTFTWTKELAGFYAILALCFYLAGWRKNDRLRMTAAFFFMSAGILVHYSAGVYCAFLALHYLLFVFWKRARRWRELAMIVAASGLLLATWFGWSAAVYGSHATFASNTSVILNQQYRGNKLQKIAVNIWNSTLPIVVRSRPQAFGQPRLAANLRDNAFIFYQTNVVFTMGLVGGPVVLGYLVWRLLQAFRGRRPWTFWMAMVPFCFMVGIATVGEKDPFGVAHLTQLPLEVLGLCLLANLIYTRRTLLVLLAAGCLIDFSIGILLQVHFEGFENTPHRTVFSGLHLSEDQGPPGVGASTRYSLTPMAWGNWFRKHQYALSTKWLSELSQYRPGDPAFQQRSAALRSQLQGWINEDQKYWGGWYERHDGTMTFLGDHVAGKSGGGTRPATFLLIALMLALMRKLLKEGYEIAR